ncbi:MAG: hypothetical protein AB7S74_19010 [Hyphomicrobium sp.]
MSARSYSAFEHCVTANGTTHFIHDQWGNVIAELDATGATLSRRFRHAFRAPAGSALAGVHLAAGGRNRSHARVTHDCG